MSQSEGYRLVKSLGQGVSGGVFLAETAAGPVAIRQFQTPSEPSGALWLAQREYFLQGARQASGLVHPRIVAVLEVIDEETDAYVATEYISSETLATALERESFSPERANYLLRNVAVALDYAHQNGVTHGDVKPSNIFVLPQGGTKIGDFAISPRAWPGRPADFLSAWIHPYIAPEAITAPQTIGPASDRYALAAIAYHLYTGKPLFAGMQPDAGPAIVRGAIPQASSINGQIRSATDAVLMRALSRDPQQRYRSCLEFADALDSSLAPEELVAARAASAGPGNRNLIYGLGALGLLAAGAVAAALWPSHTKPVQAEVRPGENKTIDTRNADAKPQTGQSGTSILATATKPAAAGSTTGLNRNTDRAANTRAADSIAKPSPVPRQVVSIQRDGIALEDRRSGRDNYPPASPISRPPLVSNPAPSIPEAPPANSAFQTPLVGAGRPGDARGLDLKVFSRGSEIGSGISFSMKDQTLGEMAVGDLRAAVAANGPLPKGRVSVEWWLDKVRMDQKILTPQQLGGRGGAVVEYGNEPTPGVYRIILRTETSVLKDLTFRITP